MKTAMQKVIETVYEMINNGGDPDLLAVKIHLENSLEAEKEQMMEVVEFCDAHCDDGHFDKEGAIANIKSTFNL